MQAGKKLIMRSAKLIFAACFLLLCAGLAHADNITPPDGDLGVLGGSNSTQITSLSFGITFLPCSDPSVSADCALIASENGGVAPQELFGGVNDTGVAWNTLAVALTVPTWNTGTESLSCSGGTFFSINNCSSLGLVTSNNPQTVLVDFTQGTGTGIGCYDDEYTNSIAINADIGCFFNSIENYPNAPYDNPLVSSCTAPEVCGASNFVIALGYGPDSQFPTGGPNGNSLPDVNAAAGADGAPVPEPPTLPCLLAGLVGILSLSLVRKKITA